MHRVSCVVFVSLFASAASAANYGPGFKQTMVPVEGCTLSATVGGKGPIVLLLHGYAETAQMWKPLAIRLAPRFTVVAIDLPAIGDSSIPASGIDMTTSAKRVHEAMRKLGYERARSAARFRDTAAPGRVLHRNARTQERPLLGHRQAAALASSALPKAQH